MHGYDKEELSDKCFIKVDVNPDSIEFSLLKDCIIKENCYPYLPLFSFPGSSMSAYYGSALPSLTPPGLPFS